MVGGVFVAQIDHPCACRSQTVLYFHVLIQFRRLMRFPADKLFRSEASAAIMPGTATVGHHLHNEGPPWPLRYDDFIHRFTMLFKAVSLHGELVQGRLLSMVAGTSTTRYVELLKLLTLFHSVFNFR